MRELLQSLEGPGHEGGRSLLIVRDDGPLVKDGHTTALRKYTVVGTFVSTTIFQATRKNRDDQLPNPDTLTQLWSGNLSFQKEVIHTSPHPSVNGFRSLNDLVENGGLNPDMYEQHYLVK